MVRAKAEPTTLDLALAAFKAAEEYTQACKGLAVLVATGGKGMNDTKRAIMREDVALAAYNDAKTKLLIAVIPPPTN